MQTLFLQPEEDGTPDARRCVGRSSCGQVRPVDQVGGFLQDCSRLSPSDQRLAGTSLDRQAEPARWNTRAIGGISSIRSVVQKNLGAICFDREPFDVRTSGVFKENGAEPIDAGVLHQELECGGRGNFGLPKEQTRGLIIDLARCCAETIAAGYAHGDQANWQRYISDDFAVHAVL